MYARRAVNYPAFFVLPDKTTVKKTSRRVQAVDLDTYDLAILEALAEDAGQTTQELSSRVHLSRTAVARRVRNLRDRGVLGGFRAEVDFEKLGFAVRAHVYLSEPKANSFELLERVLERPEVLSASVMVGDKLIMIDSIAADMRHLHRFLTWLEDHGGTETTVVLRRHRSSIPLRKRLERVDRILETTDDRLGY